MKLKFLLLMLAVLMLKNLSAHISILENGDQVAWDGQYYDFRDAEGVKMIKLWIPPNTNPIKGVFISGHGGGSGDSRNFARDENVRALAMRLGFAVAGLHNFPGRRVYSDRAAVFFDALKEFASLGQHPEIANLPFVIYGSSNGGAATYGFVNYAPERAICFVANVSAGGSPSIPVDGALKVPGVFIIGKFDALIGERGINRTAEMMDYARPKGALWSWALELKGHEDGASFDIYMKLVEQAVAARYPESGNPRVGPVKLNELTEESGWLVDLDSWDSGLTYVDSYDNYEGDKQKAGWVLNKDMAYVYRSLATHHNPISVKVKEFDPTYNPHTDPGTMFSLGGPVANPGDEITIICETEDFNSWEKLEFFNGAQTLGEVNSPGPAMIKTRLKPASQVYCLTVLATDESGQQRTCTPLHFFVRDPDRRWKVKLDEPIFEGEKTNAGSRNTGKTLSATQPDPGDSVLVSYGLTPELEKQFSSGDNKVSGFWNLIDDELDYIWLSARENAKDGSAFNFVLTHDCNMTVKSAYGADGIYLLFEINDDNDVAWPNELAGTENEQFYLNFDAVDVLMDSRSVEEISDPDNIDLFFQRGFGLTVTTKQYQIACGTEKERPTGFVRSRPDPWDMAARYYTFEEAKMKLGLEVENIKTDYFYKAQEIFIPWSEYGDGLEQEPDARTRLGFAAGFNDRDEGEHFPPGVNTSGGSVHASNSIRWIGKTDPWGASPIRSKPPYAWGEIEIGPMLK
jgi:pimeloyl-ACP methyl ester carboxylesterase